MRSLEQEKWRPKTENRTRPEGNCAVVLTACRKQKFGFLVRSRLYEHLHTPRQRIIRSAFTHYSSFSFMCHVFDPRLRATSMHPEVHGTAQHACEAMY